MLLLLVDALEDFCELTVGRGNTLSAVDPIRQLEIFGALPFHPSGCNAHLSLSFRRRSDERRCGQLHHEYCRVSLLEALPVCCRRSIHKRCVTSGLSHLHLPHRFCTYSWDLDVCGVIALLACEDFNACAFEVHHSPDGSVHGLLTVSNWDGLKWSSRSFLVR